jgi:hypothetical protein
MLLLLHFIAALASFGHPKTVAMGDLAGRKFTTGNLYWEYTGISRVVPARDERPVFGLHAR